MAKYKTREQKDAFWTQLLQRVQSIPGVEAAAISANSPFDDTENDNYFHVTGTPPVPADQRPTAETSVVSPDYFRLMRMPILRGRGFGPEDLPGEKGHSRSIIIDESFAQKYFAGKDPIGQHIDDNHTLDEHAPPMTIVGVVPRTRNEAPGELNVESLHLVQEYLLASQDPQPENQLQFDKLRDIAPHRGRGKARSGIARFRPADRQHHDHGSSHRFKFGNTPFNDGVVRRVCRARAMLASVGLYGVMALTVTQRTRELGIRMALGAERTNIFKLVLGQGMTLMAIGIAIGLIGALLQAAP